MQGGEEVKSLLVGGGGEQQELLLLLEDAISRGDHRSNVLSVSGRILISLNPDPLFLKDRKRFRIYLNIRIRVQNHF